MSRKTTPTTPTPVDFSQIARTSQEALERMTRVQTRMLREGMGMQAELLDFARRRLGADLETQKRLGQCANMGEAMREMSAFYSTAVRDYSSEAVELMSRCASIAAESESETPAPPAKGDGKAEGGASRS